MASKSLLASLLQKQLLYTPEAQPFYTYTPSGWRSTNPHPPSQPQLSLPLPNLTILTWNIDFRAPFPRARMSSAIAHLQSQISTLPPSCAIIIHLQEMQELDSPKPQSPYSPTNPSPTSNEESANDITQLLTTPWIQERFHITDIDMQAWESGYGQISLIDKRLAISGVSKLRFVSEFQRNALLVDIYLANHPSGNPDLNATTRGSSEIKTVSTDHEESVGALRLCNVHLDSTFGHLRPIQWKALAQNLQNPNPPSLSSNSSPWLTQSPYPSTIPRPRVLASIVAGDTNANQHLDSLYPLDNGFKDAYLVLGGEESDEQGATWGFQSKDWKRWGRKRLDKILYWVGEKELLEVQEMKRFGVGIKVKDEDLREGYSMEACKREREEGDIGEVFVTDHFGLVGQFAVGGGLMTTTGNVLHK